MFASFNLPFPTSKQPTVSWSGLNGCADALALASAIQANQKLFVIVTPDAHSALRLEHELAFFLNQSQPILHFPDWETLPYDVFSPLPEIMSERLQTLTALPTVKSGALIVAANTLMHRITPPDFLAQQKLILNIGDSLSDIAQQLKQRDYQQVSQVFTHGEFALHGSVLDIFAMGNRVPLRLGCENGILKSLRAFDVESQRAFSTDEKIESLTILPAREFPNDESEKATLFDYLPKAAIFVLLPNLNEAIFDFDKTVKSRFELRKNDAPSPEKLFLSPENLAIEFKKHEQIALDISSSLPDISFNPHSKQPAQALTQFVENFDGKVLFVAESAGHREALLQTLKRESIYPKVIADWETFLNSQHSHCITVASLDVGLILDNPAIALITESQLSGEKAPQRRRRKASARQLETLVANLNELTIGAPVVHSEHGVGRYLGLQTLTIGGMEGEFLALSYANDDKLYVPVASLHVISRYTGMSEENAPLHKLGSDQWRKAKQKAIARIHDVAAELLEIHAKRAAHEHSATPLFERTDEGEYLSFAQGFRFEETPDQARAIQDIIDDFNQAKPMDRVICGDVGFGKTEVAMRAAFLAVQSGKQVAVLVPTTLLAGQHHSNFCDRFADFPIKIELMSRFVTPKQQKEIATQLENGVVDIVIGTHKLLGDGLKYKNLGLVIIDEEHRFGVRQKEQFKKLRAEIDLLTLTATPIPRTLNMAMSGLRDISIIASPPPNRHPIKTFINEWEDEQIREACQREIKRGGQVFFLHNDIKSMEKMADDLSKLIPEARLEIAHGQMHGNELERIMLDFYHQRFNILLSTTIIESGIDIPSANTIIINRADKLGLAALHQLRGRVGRSHHRAYAYLIVPPKAVMTADAIKRLDAIEAAGELGAGFMLSTHDMEIRGAGELLGEGQSGQIQEIGFTLYTELLERAVSALKSGKNPELDLPASNGAEVELQATALIPEDYLGDVHERLVLYKRIANAQTADSLRDLQIEMIDRFGLLPEPTQTLFSVSQLKQQATAMGIKKIDAHSEGGRILFLPEPNIDLGKLISLIQTQPQIYKLDGQDKLRFVHKFENVAEKIDFISALLGLIS
ncbi:MAG: transcription-repair coupling factor [Methylococcales bacterium]|nr:transcription-repair coupling factor [Methylococcales bacterium]